MSQRGNEESVTLPIVLLYKLVSPFVFATLGYIGWVFWPKSTALYVSNTVLVRHTLSLPFHYKGIILELAVLIIIGQAFLPGHCCPTPSGIPTKVLRGEQGLPGTESHHKQWCGDGEERELFPEHGKLQPFMLKNACYLFGHPHATVRTYMTNKKQKIALCVTISSAQHAIAMQVFIRLGSHLCVTTPCGFTLPKTHCVSAIEQCVLPAAGEHMRLCTHPLPAHIGT